MTPLKNTNRFFSDCLPPALVKDWRQCFRSRSAVAIFLLLQLAAWLLFFCMIVDADQTPASYLEQMKDIGKAFIALGGFTLCVAIPFRAGLTVGADTRVRSSNFLMLTPLSARRIVWGTWSSTALIILLAAACALPLLAARQLMLTAYPHIGELKPAAFDWAGFGQDVLVLGWLVLCGWMTTAYYMFTAGLPRILRGIAVIFSVFFVLAFTVETYALRELFGLREEAPLLTYAIRNVVDVLLLMVLFLELARRHYAAPAENCSRSVRLVALLPMLGYGVALLPAAFGLKSFDPEEQGFFACLFLMGALLADALLPTYSMPPHAYRFWRWLPAWCQKPGLVPSVLCMTFALPIAGLPILGEALEDHAFGSPDFIKEMLSAGTVGFNIAFSVMLWLLITDCFCGRSSEKRPMAFALVAAACSFAATCVAIPLKGNHVWEALVPLCGAAIPWQLDNVAEELFLACCLNAGAFGITLMLLLFWRGRVKKP